MKDGWSQFIHSQLYTPSQSSESAKYMYEHSKKIATNIWNSVLLKIGEHAPNIVVHMHYVASSPGHSQLSMLQRATLKAGSGLGTRLCTMLMITCTYPGS